MSFQCLLSDRRRVPGRSVPLGWPVLATVLTLVGCGSSSTTTLGPSLVKCAVTPSVPSGPIDPTGETVTLAITAFPECAWTVASSATWITELAPTAGQGNGQVQFRVGANPDETARHASILLNDVSIRLTQAGAVVMPPPFIPLPSPGPSPAPPSPQPPGTSCAFVITPSTHTVSASGASDLAISVTASAGCTWTSASQATWLVVTHGASGTGSGTLTFSVAANTGAPRSATLTVAGQPVTVGQSGNCQIGTMPASATVPASGGSATIDVTAGSGCAWTASSSDSWISISSATAGSGNGTVIVEAAANTGPARTGTVAIGGQLVAISQPSGCTYLVTPTSFSLTYFLTLGLTIEVSAGAGCGWTAASHDGWISVTSGATGAGNGFVVFSAALNLGGSRTGTLTVAGTTVTVHQDRLRLLP